MYITILLSSILSNLSFSYAPIIIFFLTILISTFSLKKSFIFFLSSAIASKKFIILVANNQQVEPISIYTSKFFNNFDVFEFLCLFFILIIILKLNKSLLLNNSRFFLINFIFFFYPAYGVLINDFNNFLTEFKFVLIFLVFYFSISTFKISTELLISSLKSILFLQIIINFIFYAYYGFDAIYLGGEIILTTVLLLLLNYQYFLSYFILLTVLLSNLYHPTRGRIVFLFLSLIITFKDIINFNKRSIIFSLLIVLIMSIFFIFGLDNFTTEIKILKYKLRSFQSNFIGDESVRLIELKNIVSHQLELANIHKLLIGTGYGSYFSDQYYSFDYDNKIFLSSAFSEEEINSGKFLNPHGFFNYPVHKNGLLSTLLFFLYVIFFIFKNYRKSNKTTKKIILILPFLIFYLVNIKVLIFYALILHLFNKKNPSLKENYEKNI